MFFALGPPAHAEVKYTVQDLGTLGGNVSAGLAVNASGEVVGTSATADSPSHAFLYRNGVMTDLGVPFGPTSRAVAINSSGQIVVTAGGGGENRSFLLTNGNFTDLGGFGAPLTIATDINDSGQVVGFAVTASNQTHAFLYSGGTLQDLGTFGGTSANPQAINNAGVIVGIYGVPNPDAAGVDSHGFVYDTISSAFQDFGAGVGLGDINDAGDILGGGAAVGPFIYRAGQRIPLEGGRPFALNNSGVVVGDDDLGGSLHAVIYEDNRPVDLNTLIAPNPSLRLYQALGINDVGQIVGAAITSTGDTHAFLLTPIPEPAGLAVSLLGAATLLRRRSQGHLIPEIASGIRPRG